MNQNSTQQEHGRRTIVVANPHAMRWHRLQAARGGKHGTQVMLIEQLAARLAGGFLQSPDSESLQRALRTALPDIDMGELEGIRDLPGTPGALLETIGRCWQAGFDLQKVCHRHPRIAALAAVDLALRSALPPAMLAPPDLSHAALDRVALAPVLLGEVDVVGLVELAPCWRPLLMVLSQVTRVRWLAGNCAIPHWLDGSGIESAANEKKQPQILIVSAAHAVHEALEAMRWARGLLASGQASAGEIAIASVNTAEYDNALAALSQESGLALHFVHGRPLVETKEGQRLAALADALVNGLTRRRVRRCALAAMPDGWMRALPAKVALRSAASWRRALDTIEASDWPEGNDGTAQLRMVVELLLAGPAGAEAVGEQLLSGRSLAIWRNALLAGPANALPETIGRLRQDDGLDGCVTLAWMAAETLVSAPRPYVWLMGLNAGAWPRQSAEDRLLPGHIVPASELALVPLGQSDRRAFNAIKSSCEQLMLSFARRDGAGRHAVPSALLRGLGEADYRQYHAPSPHAVSESDRLLGRSAEFRDFPQAVSSSLAWRNWRSAEVTAHDGLVGPGHPAMKALVERVHSASSLKGMLRNPIAQLWQYAMRWEAPAPAEELLELDAMQFGALVHAVIDAALQGLTAVGPLSSASTGKVASAVQEALLKVAAIWEREESVPPVTVWRHTLETVRAHAIGALEHERTKMAGARAYGEVAFGGAKGGVGQSPWKNALPVPIPGTGLSIKGVIDRLDVSEDGKLAIVRDYKTGNKMIKSDTALDGGRELQRSLYACVVKALLNDMDEVRASLLYTRHMKEFVLAAGDEVQQQLAVALLVAQENLTAGRALPGPDAGGEFDPFALLLPAESGYWKRKEPAVQALLGEGTNIWEMK